MKLLFTHSYFLELDAKQLQTHKPYPPLAPLYAAALLREQNHSVALADIQFAKSPDEIESHLNTFKPDVLAIYDDGFNYLTKMCLTNMREAAFRMLELAKQKGITTVVSSSDASDHLEKYFAKGADYILIGEGEQTLSELIAFLENKPGTTKTGIEGLVFREDGNTVKNKSRQVMRELNDLPPPAWDLVDLEPYHNTWMKHQGYFSLNFVTTRGCPYKCNWCAKPIYGNRYNSHAPEKVAELIQSLHQKTNFDHIWFADDIFGLKPGWLRDFNAAMKKRGLKIPFKIQSRADLLLEDEAIAHLAESGCEEVWMGAESGSQRILDAMDKGTTVDQIKEATRLLKKHGIKACFFLQFGYIGENMEDIQKTLVLVEELSPDDIGISVSYPLPGTKFYERVKNELVNKQNWTNSDDLDMMFNSTYSSDFYRLLQRYVHYTFRTNKAIEELKKGQFKRSSLLGPYYRLKKLQLKRKLLKFEPRSELFLLPGAKPLQLMTD
jgi:anaerobic magnesium-protoporphyrin IX monomethyl ester cyclase